MSESLSSAIQTGAENVLWNLDMFYYGSDDPQLDLDLNNLIEKMKAFNANFKGQLATKLSEAITDYSEIKMLEAKVNVYLFLRQSENTGDAKVKAKLAEIEKKLSGASGEYLAFVILEMVALPDDILENIYNQNEVVKKHRPWIEHLRLFKPNLLSEPVESALTKRAPFGPGAWGDFFGEVEADLEFIFKEEKKTITEIFHIVSDSKDGAERALALKILNEGLAGAFAKYAAQILYMVAGSLAVEVKERKYQQPMEERNKHNRLSADMVEALHQAVIAEAGPLARKYYRLKAAHLGQKTLRWSDRNAPLSFSDTTIMPWDEAKEIIFKAYESFSPTLAKIAAETFLQKRIHAPVIKGKKSGAYNYSVVLPENKSYSFTFINYMGSNDDVMTLAHELGHGVHGILGAEIQGVLMYHAPIALCETASIFGEITTFNFLKQRMLEQNKKQDLLALIMNKIDHMINTTVRQIGFSNFERRLHGLDAQYKNWQEVKKYSVEELDQIWLETLAELYGAEGDIFTYEDAAHLWSYIPHFHEPFYVYGYAFGELLTHSLSATRNKLGEKFEPLYLELLRSGDSKNVSELLKPFNIDPTAPTFWSDGIKIGLGALVEEAEKLSLDLGLKL